jgi:membrane-associated phospholipid phosphatase
MFKLALVLLVFTSAFKVNAEEKFKFKQIFTEIPDSSLKTLKKSFSKESLPAWGAILGSTAILYHYDEKILASVQETGRDWGIGNDDNTSSAVSIEGHEIVRLPSDTGSFLYFLGDGWMHAGIGGAFLGAGHLRNDHYAFNTGIMIWHGMVVSTIFNQTLKRSFGRESPVVSTSPRGSWNLFPSFNDYNSKTASYDGMPSGHVMATTLVFTIISERYQEYNHITYPVAGVWLSALMLGMVNNGAHWASDYPLGIAMGYVVGKISTQIGKKETDEIKAAGQWKIMPTPRGIYLTKSF